MTHLRTEVNRHHTNSSYLDARIPAIMKLGIRALIRMAAVRLLALLALAGLFAAIYFLGVRPSQLRWGATATEVDRFMPGDGQVHHPTFYATRAITISGRPDEIWPWLAQMGYDRAGYYGYDLIENLGSATGIRSATSTLPGFQHPKTGDVLPISAVAHMFFGEVKPGCFLIWRAAADPPDGVFTWALYPLDANHTRLVSRIRLHYHWTDRRLALDLFTEFADSVAVPKILQGIKDRVEGRTAEPLGVQITEIATWLLALAECAAALWFLLSWRRWERAWLLTLGSGLVLLFALYARAPAWSSAALALAWGAALVLARKAQPR
jgi:hypothetical protein